jgi:hypothetical protein
MTDHSPHFSIRPYGDRWAVVSGEEVVLVANSQASARAVVATADSVLEKSGIGSAAEARTFASDED